jgi:RNA polymerase sigma-70 factor (ECF subfamily)
VKTWLFGIAANLARHHHRSEKRKTAATAAFAVQPRRIPTEPSHAVAREQQRRWLAAAIESLSPALREAYVLCVIEEIEGKEAARALGIRDAALWRRLTDARKALRTALEEMQR